MKIVIKIGSALLTNGDGKVNDNFVADVCRQVAHLIESGHEVLIISSGAIASDNSKHRLPNLRAAIGQIKLISTYAKHFYHHNLEVAQLLLTDAQLIEGKTAMTKKLIAEAFREKIICVINANDVIDDAESKAFEYCADNDKLAELVCRMLKANMIIIGFTEDGIIDRDGKIIDKVYNNDLNRIMALADGGNKLGHGDNGMLTKIQVLGTLAVYGTIAILAPGKEKNFILRAYNGERKFGTRFLFK